MFAEQENSFADLVKVGEVSSVNHKNGTVRVAFDDEDYVSGDLQVLQKNTLENGDFWMPDVGEDVVCVFILNGNGDGFVLGSFYADEVSPPIKGKTKRYVKFKDDAEFVYDWEAHKLKAKIGKTLIEATEDSVQVSGSSKVKVSVPDIEFIGNLKVDGNIETTGKMTADGEVTANSKLAPVKLSTHLHMTSVGPSASPTPGT